jgi:endonuclease/exonuclease/phosphatase family metal-dependent hydrolase
MDEREMGAPQQTGLFTSARMVTPVEWHAATGHWVRAIHHDMLVARVAGLETRLATIHWNGSDGPLGFDVQAARTGQLAAYPTIIGGDFNTTSSAPGERVYDDWGQRCRDAGKPWAAPQKGRQDAVSGEWRTNTESFDDLLACGWWDIGAHAGDFTTTAPGSDLRIDRLVVSDRHPATYVKGSYRVIPCPRSDHQYVYAELLFPDPARDTGSYPMTA